MQDETYCPKCSLLQPENGSAITIDFLVRLPETERMSPCICKLFVSCCFFVCTHTHTHFVCRCVDLCVCGFDHTWVCVYLHSICICFAWGKAVSADARPFTDSLRGQNRLFLCLRQFYSSHRRLQSSQL